MRRRTTWIATIVIAAAAATSLSGQSATRAVNNEISRIQESTTVLHALSGTPDSGIPEYLLQRAAAVVVIPDLIKGGFVVGASHGRGIIATRETTGKWSNPGFVNITGGSIGWQIGVTSVDLVLLVMNRKGVDDLLEDRFTIGGSATVAAGPVGRSTHAAPDAQFSSQVLAYSRAKGLFAGATLDGAALHADDSANEAFYGKDAKLETILQGGAMQPPTTASAAISQWNALLQKVAMGESSMTAAR